MISSPSSTGRNPLTELVTFLETYASSHHGCSKDELARATASQFGLRKERSVYFCPEFAIRFSWVAKGSFSGTVCALARLKRFDHTPFIVCVVRPTGIELLLANSTFLKKISHSSQRLTADRVRGSFNGSDIARTYGGLHNAPDNFDALFTVHAQFTWEENLERLVEQTNAIVATGLFYEPSPAERKHILDAPALGRMLSRHPEYIQLHADLSRLVQDNTDAILAAARIDNVNLRGNAIEQIITQAGNFHNVEDARRTLTLGTEVKLDIKTKILNLSSSPKGYDIDKTLRALSNGNTVVSFFFVGVNLEDEAIVTCLVSIFDRVILDATRIQFHWAGRNSRGVTQLSGDLKSLFGPDFSENIDVSAAQVFLQKLINSRPPTESRHD